MNRKLRQEDRRAVDLLLDRTAVAARGNGNAVYAGNGGQNLASVEKVLHLLDALPPIDPPADLVTRTLQHIAHASNDLESRSRSAHKFDPSRPMA